MISPREGPVTIETVHGGTGTSTVHFVFKSGGSNVLKVPSVDGLFGGKRKSKGNGESRVKLDLVKPGLVNLDLVKLSLVKLGPW